MGIEGSLTAGLPGAVALGGYASTSPAVAPSSEGPRSTPSSAETSFYVSPELDSARIARGMLCAGRLEASGVPPSIIRPKKPPRAEQLMNAHYTAPVGQVEVAKTPQQIAALTKNVLEFYGAAEGKFRDPDVTNSALTEPLTDLPGALNYDQLFLIVGIAELYRTFRKRNPDVSEESITLNDLSSGGKNLAVRALSSLSISEAESLALIRIAASCRYPKGKSTFETANPDSARAALEATGWAGPAIRTVEDLLQTSIATVASKVTMPNALRAEVARLAPQRLTNEIVLLLARASGLCPLLRDEAVYRGKTFAELRTFNAKGAKDLVKLKLFAEVFGAADFPLSHGECMALMLLAESARDSHFNINESLRLLNAAGWSREEISWAVELMADSVSYFAGPVELTVADVEYFLGVSECLGRLARSGGLESMQQLGNLDEVLEYTGSTELLGRMRLFAELRDFHRTGFAENLDAESRTVNMTRLAQVRVELWTRLDTLWNGEDGAHREEMTLVDVLLYAGLTHELQKAQLGLSENERDEIGDFLASPRRWRVDRDHVALSPLVLALFRALQGKSSRLNLNLGVNTNPANDGITSNNVHPFLPLVDQSFVDLSYLQRILLARDVEEAGMEDLRLWRVTREIELKSRISDDPGSANRKTRNAVTALEANEKWFKKKFKPDDETQARARQPERTQKDDEEAAALALQLHTSYHVSSFWKDLIAYATENDRLLVVSVTPGQTLVSVTPGTIAAFSDTRGYNSTNRHETLVLRALLNGPADYVERIRIYDTAQEGEPHPVLDPGYRTSVMRETHRLAHAGKVAELLVKRAADVDPSLGMPPLPEDKAPLRIIDTTRLDHRLNSAVIAGARAGIIVPYILRRFGTRGFMVAHSLDPNTGQLADNVVFVAPFFPGAATMPSSWNATLTTVSALCFAPLMDANGNCVHDQNDAVVYDLDTPMPLLDVSGMAYATPDGKPALVAPFVLDHAGTQGGPPAVDFYRDPDGTAVADPIKKYVDWLVSLYCYARVLFPDVPLGGIGRSFGAAFLHQIRFAGSERFGEGFDPQIDFAVHFGSYVGEWSRFAFRFIVDKFELISNGKLQQAQVELNLEQIAFVFVVDGMLHGGLPDELRDLYERVTARYNREEDPVPLSSHELSEILETLTPHQKSLWDFTRPEVLRPIVDMARIETENGLSLDLSDVIGLSREPVDVAESNPNFGPNTAMRKALHEEVNSGAGRFEATDYEPYGARYREVVAGRDMSHLTLVDLLGVSPSALGDGNVTLDPESRAWNVVLAFHLADRPKAVTRVLAYFAKLRELAGITPNYFPSMNLPGTEDAEYPRYESLALWLQLAAVSGEVVNPFRGGHDPIAHNRSPEVEAKRNLRAAMAFMGEQVQAWRRARGMPELILVPATNFLPQNVVDYYVGPTGHL